MWVSHILLCASLALFSVQPSFGQEAFGFLTSECDVSEDALSSVANADIPRTCIEFNGRTRCYYTYVPPCARGDTPLVIDLHPLVACPSKYILYSGWFLKARNQCFALMFPIGNTDFDEVDQICWAVPGGLDLDLSDNPATGCCCNKIGGNNKLVDTSPVDPEEVGDADFVRYAATEFVNNVASDQAIDAQIDTKRIYVAGHSNGCYLGFAMAMLHSDFVAAVSCMAGSWVTPPAANYSPTPIWSLIGDRDIVVPINGRTIAGSNEASFDETFEQLQDLNGCTGVTSKETSIPEMNLLLSRGGLKTRTATGCQNDATVEFLTLKNAGHVPFANVPERLPPPPLATTTTIDTTALALDFVFARQLDQVPPEFAGSTSPGPGSVTTTTSVPAVTASPTGNPTASPTGNPTASPSAQPSASPTVPLPTEGLSGLALLLARFFGLFSFRF